MNNHKINDFVIRFANVNGTGSASANWYNYCERNCIMSVIAEAEELAFKLSDSERAKLAEKLIASLPGPFVEDDDGIEEALQRSHEMDENPETATSFEELDAMIKKRFPQCSSD